MGRCQVCGNQNSGLFEIVRNGKSYTFDSFECAIHALAQVCEHCGCRIIGHPLEVDGSFFCCGPCAQEAGAIAAHR